MVQGTPHYQSTVGLSQAIILWKLVQNLIILWGKHQVINRGSQHQHQQEADTYQVLHVWPPVYQVTKWCLSLRLIVQPIFPGKRVGPGEGRGEYNNSQIKSPWASNLPLLLLHILSILLLIIKWVLNHISHGIIRIIPRVVSPILNLFFWVTLIPMVLIWPVIHFHIVFTHSRELGNKLPYPIWR